MKMEYHNGVRVTKHHHEKSALEVAIERYEELAKQHHKLQSDAGDDETKKDGLKASLAYLECE